MDAARVWGMQFPGWQWGMKWIEILRCTVLPHAESDKVITIKINQQHSTITYKNHTFSLLSLLVWVFSCLVFSPLHWHCSIIISKVLSLCCKVASNKTLVQPFMRARGTIGQRTGTAAAWNSSTSSMGLVQSLYGSTKSCRMTSWSNQYGWITTAQTMYGNMVRFHWQLSHVIR